MKRKEEKEEREEKEGKSVGVNQGDVAERVDKGREERDRERDMRGDLLLYYLTSYFHAYLTSYLHTY
jgi:hypothetical protein